MSDLLTSLASRLLGRAEQARPKVGTRFGGEPELREDLPAPARRRVESASDPAETLPSRWTGRWKISSEG